ncbi:uncharacterized protein LOC110902207 [Helianthus annuus]|uniref:uncharacterized protein LOC110902207 n=1 Tax=Helianthus annuus TaxID=4232 RepID=UPI000B8F6B04|nr:uncharacterized protein LOC110902207 [Helianthus annuus]
MDHKIHPATTVNNIKSLIPVTLEMETGQFSSWSELFKIQCRAHLVIDHLSPRPSASSSSSVSTDKDKETTPKQPADDDWERLDAIVLQWIYGTISNDLLHTILKPNTTAYEAWTTLESIFHDNKSSRAIQLRHSFSNTRLDDYPNISAYCQALKVLADQLSNVGAPVDDVSLVLQLISGLNEQYEGIATILQQQDPLPSFYTARSQLVLVESRKKEQALQAAKTAGTTLNVTTAKVAGGDYRQDRQDFSSDRQRGRGRSRGRGRGRGSWGRGRSSSSQNFSQNFAPQGNWFQNPSVGYWSPNAPSSWAGPPQWTPWTAPPCPYPTTPSRPNNNHNGNGLLGPRPDQTYHAAYAPTNIEQALYTMSLNQPDVMGIMDTGATTNMTNEQGLQDPDPHPPVQQQR